VPIRGFVVLYNGPQYKVNYKKNKHIYVVRRQPVTEKVVLLSVSTTAYPPVSTLSDGLFRLPSGE
jgi:hypothetical protein